ncbi:MAG: PSD1 and planctomycete cytochrome C domain-containing protein [Planctomycetota bacterium]|nr:PSD1 and planctomycete cytochrome C domain-containing protein [Planctomycetota bacterium]
MFGNSINPSMRQRLKKLFQLLVVAGLCGFGVCLFTVPEPVRGQEIEQSTFSHEVDFSEDIRPILADNCFACHGPDAGARKAKLRLDTFDGATTARRFGSPIVPGDLEASLLIERITEPEAEFRMPPPEAKKTLSPEQIELLKRWIEQGATYEAHWAFSSPRRPDVPDEQEDASLQNPIDAFILSMLKKQWLEASEPASREDLIRRLSYDLTGLPPSVEAIDAFLADVEPDAYERLVDRLLASPRYGERMAVDWLDAARYADTHGYHYDNERTMWHWRDWVVDAFNDNMPYDEFTIQQLAGDLLPEATLQQRIASGFNRNHGISWEGGIIPEEYRIEYVVDRVSTTSTVWMGLTMGCARCHDHKFDPVSQKEFYSFSAFFNSIAEQGADGQKGNAAPFLPTPSDTQKLELEILKVEVESLTRQYEEPQIEIDGKQAIWEQEIASRWSGWWSTIDPESYSTDEKSILVEQEDHSLLATGPHPVQDTYEIFAHTDATNIGAIRLEALTDESLPGNGPGRAKHSNFVLSEFELAIAPADHPEAFVAVKWISALADFSQRGFFVDRAIDGNHETGWAIQGDPYGEVRTAFFIPEEPFGFPEGSILRIRIHHRSEYVQHSMGRVRLAMSSDPTLRAKLIPSRLDGWEVAGPYEAETNQLAFETVFPPEPRDVGPAETVEWQKRPDFSDGQIHELKGERQATYLKRIIHSPDARRLRVALGSDDTLKVWLNGSLQFTSEMPRSAKVDQDFLWLELKPGANELLLKVVNYGGESGFYFDPREDTAFEVPLNILLKAARPSEDRNEHLQQVVRDHFRSSTSPHHRDLIARLRETQAQLDALKALVPSAMVMKDLETPRKTYVLERGRYDMPTELVQAGVPAFLPPLGKDTNANRLDLAIWLIDPKHPLTARVAANRLWQQLFGRGLVETAEDFGTQGAAPSHPELLDWLAIELIERSWNIKAMLKLMVMSATYRQSSTISPLHLRHDPDNVWLARAPRFRLPAEMIRDGALASSGLLVEKIGGPSVKPYQPAGLWKEVGSDFNAFSANTFVPDHGESLYRRSLYTFWKRTLGPPSMQSFDAPSREFCIVRRERTNTPQQALVLMNDPTFVEAARVLAQRVMLEHPRNAQQQVDLAARLVMGRSPDSQEMKILLHLNLQQLEVYRDDPEAALELLNVGESPRDETLDPATHGAMTMVMSTLMNLDETVTKD